MMNFVFSNFGQKLLAVFAAVIFWIFLLGVQNNFYEVPEKVPLEIFNLGENYAVLETDLAVKVKISSPDPIQFQKITANDFQAAIDLRDLEEGRHEVPVTVTSKLSNISIIKVEPKNIALTIESAEEKKFNLELAQKGRPAEGFEVQKIFSDVKEVTIKGGSNLKDVKKVQAVLELDGTENSTLTKEGVLQALDVSGNILENIEFTPQQILISAEIGKAKVSKTVSVIANLDAELQQKYGDKVQVVPSEIVLIGPQEILNEIKSVQTEQVRAQDLFGGGTVKKKLILPASVSLKPNEPEQITLNFF